MGNRKEIITRRLHRGTEFTKPFLPFILCRKKEKNHNFAPHATRGAACNGQNCTKSIKKYHKQRVYGRWCIISLIIPSNDSLYISEGDNELIESLDRILNPVNWQIIIIFKKKWTWGLAYDGGKDPLIVSRLVGVSNRCCTYTCFRGTCERIMLVYPVKFVIFARLGNFDEIWRGKIFISTSAALMLVFLTRFVNIEKIGYYNYAGRYCSFLVKMFEETPSFGYIALYVIVSDWQSIIKPLRWAFVWKQRQLVKIRVFWCILYGKISNQSASY